MGQNLMLYMKEPFSNFSYILGTDQLGRDLFEQILIGSKVSFTVELVSTLGGLIIGVIAGLYAGYYGGIVQTIIMRFGDVQLALPFILLAIIIMAISESGMDKVIILMIVASWAQYTRLVRSSVLSLK